MLVKDIPLLVKVDLDFRDKIMLRTVYFEIPIFGQLDIIMNEDTHYFDLGREIDEKQARRIFKAHDEEAFWIEVSGEISAAGLLRESLGLPAYIFDDKALDFKLSAEAGILVACASKDFQGQEETSKFIGVFEKWDYYILATMVSFIEVHGFELKDASEGMAPFIFTKSRPA